MRRFFFGGDMKNKKIRTAAFVFICVFAVVLVIFFNRGRQHDKILLTGRISSEQDISASLDFSFSFIAEEYERQKSFETFLCDEAISDCGGTVFSLFISTAVLNIIQESERSDIDSIKKREVQRTLHCQDDHFLWDFYCIKHYKQGKHYYPDLDSTSLASWFLSSQKVEHNLEKIREQIRKTQLHDGALLTFLRDFQPPPHAMNQDPVANANALVLLSEEIPSVCGFINRNFDKSVYYTDDVVVFYMLSKAYSKGVKCIKPALDELYRRIKSSDLLKKNDMPMHLAMFVTALMEVDCDDGKVLDAAIKQLLENEWYFPFKEPFFRTGLNQKRDFYYSPAFSAAVYAEALTNIKSEIFHIRSK